MAGLQVRINDGISILTLLRGKVNALSESFVVEIHAAFKAMEDDPAVRAVILTGNGKFFCFGFDIPELIKYSKEEFMGHLDKVADLYSYLFSYPKPVTAALNGHATAGGCVVATACDYRIMTRGKAKIGLTEINLGSTVTTSAIAMLKHCIGGGQAERMLYSGTMLTAEEARGIGLVNEVAEPEDIAERALFVAKSFADKDPDAFRSIKTRLRAPVADEMKKLRAGSLREFADLWYSEKTRKKLAKVKILI